MSISPELIKCIKHIDFRKKSFVEELRKIVAIAGVSSDPGSRKELSLLADWFEERLKALGFIVVKKEARSDASEGDEATGDTPLVLLGTLTQGTDKKTLLYYCHLDVADVDRDSWETDPFELTEKNGKLYGRGTARMKGPLLCFIHAIETYKTLGLEVPVNIKILCESMREVGSTGIESCLEEIKTGFLTGIDCILINDGHWLGKRDPCIIHASRGFCFFELSVEGPRHDFHSGDYGGIMYEPLQDVLFIINRLVDVSGYIKIPEFNENVLHITPDEEDIYHSIKVDMEDYRKTAGLIRLGHAGKPKQTLMNVWRNPVFTLHFIDSNLVCQRTANLSIPKKATARFSIRLVSKQNPDEVCELLYDYIEKELRERCTPNNVTLSGSETLPPWIENHMHWNYEAAKIATREIFKQETNLIRESDGYPTLLKLREYLPKKNILVLPVVNNESNPGKEGENISLTCYIESTKLITSYLHKLSVVSKKR